MNDNEQPHLRILIPDLFPDIVSEKFNDDLQFPGLNIKVKKISFGPFNCLDWAIPTAIAVYIFKGYFDSFLKEAGKDHYEILKNWLKKTSNNSRSIKCQVISATQSSDKIINENSQSKAFSIKAYDVENGISIKFLFDETHSNESWELAIEELLLLLEDYYTNNRESKIKLSIRNKHLEKDVFAIIGPKNGEWEFTDLKTYISKTSSV